VGGFPGVGRDRTSGAASTFPEPIRTPVREIRHACRIWAGGASGKDDFHEHCTRCAHSARGGPWCPYAREAFAEVEDWRLRRERVSRASSLRARLDEIEEDLAALRRARKREEARRVKWKCDNCGRPFGTKVHRPSGLSVYCWTRKNLHRRRPCELCGGSILRFTSDV
jgi:hypothetical protein